MPSPISVVICLCDLPTTTCDVFNFCKLFLLFFHKQMQSLAVPSSSSSGGSSLGGRISVLVGIFHYCSPFDTQLSSPPPPCTPLLEIEFNRQVVFCFVVTPRPPARKKKACQRPGATLGPITTLPLDSTVQSSKVHLNSYSGKM